MKGKVWEEEEVRRTRDLPGRAIELGDLPRLVPRFPLSQHFRLGARQLDHRPLFTRRTEHSDSSMLAC